MERIAGRTGPIIIRILVALGAAGAVWAVIGLFNPVEMTALSGTLDSGKPYATTFYTSGLNSLYGLLVCLAAAVNLSVSVRLFQRAYSGLKSFLWAGFSVVLLLAVPYVGRTPVISWLSGIPAEIQHGISTPYVKMIETPVTNIPLLVAVGFIVTYVATAVVYSGISRGKG